jgi:glutamyl-tRNA synthetase
VDEEANDQGSAGVVLSGADKVRVRFAPSPTGYLHIGGARTALFNWLYARHTGGTFVLRIEDTDAARNSQEAVDVILNGLRWLGLEWDEGPMTGAANGPSKGEFGPYFQSQRSENYKRRVQELIAKGMAYEHEGAVKFRMQREPITIPDLVVGDVFRELTDRERLDPDFVIVRSDGQPVFHFVNVVDDLEMGITHVIRGEDHLANTAKHLALFKAFGVEAPKYAHIPLILNIDGSKMSKRDTGASLQSYIDGGYTPEAIVNYLYLLGWSPKENREIMPLEEVVRMFDLPQILRHNARFDIDKLHWVNGEYIRTMTVGRFKELAIAALHRAGLDTTGYSQEYIDAAFATCKEKIKQFSEMPGYGGFYFKEEIELDAATRAEFTAEVKQRAAALLEAFEGVTEFKADKLQETLKATAKGLGVKPGLLVHPLRLATTGSTIGPSLYHLLEIIGREKTLGRLKKALEL